MSASVLLQAPRAGVLKNRDKGAEGVGFRLFGGGNHAPHEERHDLVAPLLGEGELGQQAAHEANGLPGAQRKKHLRLLHRRQFDATIPRDLQQLASQIELALQHAEAQKRSHEGGRKRRIRDVELVGTESSEFVPRNLVAGHAAAQQLSHAVREVAPNLQRNAAKRGHGVMGDQGIDRRQVRQRCLGARHRLFLVGEGSRVGRERLRQRVQAHHALAVSQLAHRVQAAHARARAHVKAIERGRRLSRGFSIVQALGQRV
ncbi:alpha/beta fold hydrolase [Babesia caballi]|uniref:Alpha/beta fold hydrolase n=1 Tax=Babesia caballi TaxID=5871 RepID=A0AAV4LZK2_BABCB|nr:alpha/beta fold hydrolase [Babesia caballi]